MSIGNTFCEAIIPTNELLDVKEIERSIIKKYRKGLWAKFVKGVKEYNLVEEGDKIAIAISGGKDSLLLAKLFQEMKKHNKVNFDLEFISMDPGFNNENLKTLKKNCKHLGIDVKIKESNIFEIVDKIAKDYPCFMCAKMRRGFLYEFAQELGCNKLALGHHFNDIIETTLLNVLYAGQFKTMMPKLTSTNFKNMELIRPMCYIREKDIIKYTMNTGIFAMNCGCVVAADKTSSKRQEVKELIKTLKKINPLVEESIYRSAGNVNLNAIIGYTKDGKKHSFLDE